MLQIYKESAGSGKTYKLAYEYIRLLLGRRDPETGATELYRSGDNHRRILAITFTNKATDEMKRRIMHELALLAGMEPKWEGYTSSYIEDLTQFYHTTPERIASAAKDALHNLIFDFNYFHISTIDAFFQLVLRTFAREAELTGNYEVELDSNFAIKMGVDEMLNSISRNPGDRDSMRVVNWISDFLLRGTDEGVFQNVFDRSNQFYGRLIKFLSDIADEKFARKYEEFMDYLSEPSRLTRFKAGLYRIADRERLKAMKASEALTEFMDSLGENPGVSKTVLSGLAKWSDPMEFPKVSNTVAKVAEDIENAYTAAGKKLRAKNGGDTYLDSLIAAVVESALKCDREIRIMRQTAKNIFVLGLLERVYHFISEYRSENNLILLSDTNSLLHRIIGDDEAPFVYERVGVWYRHFLIDEFQDTSGMQWDNLSPLLTESLSTEQDNLIIGDEKQCIYRFRDSDPTLLGTEIQKQFAAHLPSDYDPSKGNTNWRSSADVVRFNNTLFSAIASDCGFDDIYANVSQAIAPKQIDHHGYIKVKMLSDDEMGEANPDEARLGIMAAEIDRQLRSGYRGGEIAILTRGRKEAAKCIDYLERRRATDQDFYQDFRIISDDAMLLGSSRAVRLIISLLRLVNEGVTHSDEVLPSIYDSSPDPSSDSSSSSSDSSSGSSSLAGGAASTMINRYEYFSATGLEPDEALARALDLTEEIPVSLSFSNADRILSVTSLSSLVDRIIMEYLSESWRASENMYISAFQDVVIDFTSRGTDDIYSFLQWWDRTSYKLTISAPEEKNAIRVMTIHKSKGLEFKCVHIPFAEWDLYSSKSYEWFDPEGLEEYSDEIAPGDIPPILPFQPRDSDMINSPYDSQFRRLRKEQMLDELNVMYVAFTRAIDELIVLYPEPSKTFKKDGEVSLSSHLIYKTVNSKPFRDTLGEYITSEKEDGSVTIGAPTSATADKKNPPTALDPSGIIEMTPYHSREREELWADTCLENLSGLMDGSPRERGLILHDVMANIDDGSTLHSTVLRLKRQGMIPAEEAPAVEAYLSEAMATVADYGWYSGYRRVMTRRPLVTRKGYRTKADRIVWTADGNVDIIDYRFGEESPDHQQHMRILMNIMSAHTHSPIRGFIWYLDKNKLVRVSKEEK